MLRSGCIVLSLWSLLNLIPSAVIVVSSTFWDANTPAIGQILSAEEIRSLTPSERASLNSVAVFANGLNIALALATISMIWFGIMRRQKWAFYATCLSLSCAVMAGALGDRLVGYTHPEISLISAAILMVGAVLAGFGVHRTDA